MDNNEARFILQACRPGGQDADNPAFAAALEQARKCPDLRRWFEEEQAFDAAVAAKLRAVAVPAGLKAEILTGGKVLKMPPFRQRRKWLAAACAAALAIIAGVWLGREGSHAKQQGGKPSPPSGLPQFAAYHEDMTDFLNKIGFLSYEGGQMDKLRRFLAKHQGHSEFVLPSPLDGKPSVGCRVLDWRGRKVTLVCFYLRPDGSPGVEELHLLVINRSDLCDPPSENMPQFAERGRWQTASWSDKRHSYILAGLAEGNYLKRYVQ